MISTYLSHCNLSISESAVAAQLTELDAYLDTHRFDARWSYQIPELGEGGSCSLFGHLQDAPFLLTDYVCQNSECEHQLSRLQTIAEYVKSSTGVDWFGIYQARPADGIQQLLKLAYYGAPSRPLFPITDAFAATSNNIQTYLSEQARVINNIPDYVAKGGEYYTCDPKVQSEVCLPLLDRQGQCFGIIDAEAFEQECFDEYKLAVLVAACIRTIEYLPS
ncbi:GAF domain-containing protein [Pseudoalteromonas sp. OOF1S-7]|uniref:GAF domain-containing protein n=1 Tax=Pseudoalteromonas sp. OOF1S-7 TaxID=2917757 RepID=UPI001EF4A4CE|nr:GAF domain-containing protein [Pseudoalteromonas sp. OOF1S-7]MCG7533767.1 GAF domain-containing protein [Pseudoalteromonas sp. OOF1S-7]